MPTLVWIACNYCRREVIPVPKHNGMNILYIKPTWCTIFLVCLFLFSAVSGDYVPIIRGNNSIYATLDTCHSVWMTVWYEVWNESFHPAYQTEWQVPSVHRYSYFSWWWTHSRPKHVERRNKHTKKTCAPSWLYIQDYTGMHGQQNIKFGTNMNDWK